MRRAEVIRVEFGPHDAGRRGLSEAIDLLNILNRMDVGRETTVNAKELLVHDGGQGEGVEHVVDLVVNAEVVLVLNWGKR